MERYRALGELPTPRSVVRMNAATDPGGAAHRIIELEAEVVRLSTDNQGAVDALKLAVGCEHPDTCGGPTGQPTCLSCIDFARAHVWGQ